MSLNPNILIYLLILPNNPQHLAMLLIIINNNTANSLDFNQF